MCCALSETNDVRAFVCLLCAQNADEQLQKQQQQQQHTPGNSSDEIFDAARLPVFTTCHTISSLFVYSSVRCVCACVRVCVCITIAFCFSVRCYHACCH